MADSRNDTMSSSRPSPSPTKRDNKYLVLTAESSDGMGRIGSPIASPSSNTSSPRKQLMTETEISDLVKNALVRARQASRAFSPRTTGFQSLSPRSETTPTRSNLPKADHPRVYSPKSDSVASSESSDKISVPSLSETSPVPKQSTSQESEFEDMVEEMRMQALIPDPSMTSIGSENSSDNIIKKVEEEIANARKAAKEATRRLAGVSAKYMPEVEHSNPKIPNNPNRVTNLDEQLVEMMATTTNGSSSTDESDNFDSALDLIGEEFDEIVSGPADEMPSTYVAEEKKEEDKAFDNSSTRFSRNRSIEKCTLHYVPEDDRVWVNGSWQKKSESNNNSNEIQTGININNPSFDDFPHLYELEAVLSDEREMDRMTIQPQEKTNSERLCVDQEASEERIVSIQPLGYGEATLADEDVNENGDEIMISNDDSIEPVADDEEISADEIIAVRDAGKSDGIPTSQEVTGVVEDSFEPENPSFDEEISFDHVKAEHSTETEISTSDSKDTVPSINLSVIDSNESHDVSMDSNTSVNKPFIDEGAGDQEIRIRTIVKSPANIRSPATAMSPASVKTRNWFKDDDTMPTLNASVMSPVSIRSPVTMKSPVRIKSPASIRSPASVKSRNWFKDDDTMPTLNAGNDESKIESAITPKTINDKTTTEIRDADQVTEIAENKKNPLTSELLNDYLKTQISADLSNFTGSPAKRSTKSKDSAGSIFNFDDVSFGPQKVSFRQRYPVPQKIKKFREPSEILGDNKSEEANKNLWLSMPKAELKELLDAVMGTSIPRRSNACGTLKVLSTQKKNQLMLVRTKGFLDAVVFAISDSYSIEDMEAGQSARARAVNVVLNVSTKKDNRYHVLMHPGLRESLVKCMMDDDAEARELACATFATLAKSSHCREPMAKTEKLVEALANILKGDANSVIANIEEKQTDYSGDDELSRRDTNSHSSYSSSDRSSLTGTSYGSRSVDSQKEDPETRRRTRMNACAVLMHLSKECSVSQELCASDALLYSLVSCCREVHNPMHTKCIEILANLTRFPHNNTRLVQFPDLVNTMLYTGNQEDDIDRLWSMRVFQNLSADPSAKMVLATSTVLELLSTNMMVKHYEEQLAATSTLYNLSTEPGAVVPLTNTKNVVATLVHIAHSPASMMEVRTIACDALSTLGLWLQTLSSSGTVPEGVRNVSLPSYITSGWQRWDE